MKNIKKIIIWIVMMCLVQPMMVFAASFSISASKTTINPNETFTVTIQGNVTGNVFFSVQNGSIVGDNQVWIENNSQSVTVKGGKSGEVIVTASPAEGLSDPSGNPVDTSSSSVTIKIKQPTNNDNKPSSPKPSTPKPSNPSPTTPSKTYDMSLSSISIDNAELNPKFKQSIYDYDIEMPKGTKSITIKATPAESSVEISGMGTHKVNQGDNLIELTTHHSKTNQSKTYRLHIYVEEEPTIFLSFQDQKLGIYPSFKGSQKLNDFENVDLEIQGNKVLGKTNNKGLTLLYMLDEQNNKEFYVVHNGEIRCKYQPVIINNRNFIPLDAPIKLQNNKGLKYGKIVINEKEYSGWQFEDKMFANYSLIYLMDETGNANIYQYESSEKVLQLYAHSAALSQESVNELEHTLKTQRTILYVLSGICILSAGAWIYLILKSKKAKR